ncbi:MAG: SDR family NAD(P)-dependent oxidoreductase [Anaerolineae bacterium]|nr:SDR family NAD(P)-dependent oxidoreductase [Anaerolineae bacterium]
MTATTKPVALVTGATGAIGQAIARQLADKDYHVVLACRNEAKAQRTAATITQATGNQDVRYVLVDVARKASVEALAEQWSGRLDVLINNAAVTPRKREETPEGIELQFAANVLGYFWMVESFKPILAQSAPSRVVLVASYYAGDLDLDDPEFKRRRYSNNQAYRQSKQANRMLAVAWADRLKPLGISLNSCHPGDVNSALSNNLGFGGSQSPDQGAATPVWLATDPVGQQQTGKYFARRQEATCPFAANKAAIEQLYQICSSY